MLTAGRTSSPPAGPLLIFDGDCGFCRFWVERWFAWTGGHFRFEPFQTAAEKFPDIPRERFEKAVQLLEPNGAVYGGADAVFRLLQFVRGFGWLAIFFEGLPGFMPLARAVYAWIARHRTFSSRVTRLTWGHDPQPPNFTLARRFFASGFGLVFFCAFVSFAVQLRGLIGVRGIVPAGEFLRQVHEALGSDAYWNIPSVFWWSSSDAVLLGACIAGAFFSCLITVGICPGGCSLICWALYLSLSGVSSPFLDFQWDTLLLETALLAAVFLPWRIRPRWKAEPGLARIGRWMLWWLLFRLMFESGVVKLTSGDPTWHDLTALTYHYETQPLPFWPAWYASQSPLWLLKAETVLMFAAELIAPFLIIAPRRLRHGGALAMIALQIGIMATGNYAFFNWLTILLCLTLFDQTAWPASWRRRSVGSEALPTCAGRPWAPWVFLPFATVIVLFTFTQLLGSFRLAFEWPISLERVLGPFRSFNSYGLFRVMTTERDEIVVEGSNDGQIWQPYTFRWKPGDLHERPHLVAPHQPRLDWQMWFAALGSYRQNEWFINFLIRLLQGSPDVLALLDGNPFPEKPPRYIRAVLYEYHFTHSGDGSAWWRREQKGPYCPPLSLR